MSWRNVRNWRALLDNIGFLDSVKRPTEVIAMRGITSNDHYRARARSALRLSAFERELLALENQFLHTFELHDFQQVHGVMTPSARYAWIAGCMDGVLPFQVRDRLDEIHAALRALEYELRFEDLQRATEALYDAIEPETRAILYELGDENLVKLAV